MKYFLLLFFSFSLQAFECHQLFTLHSKSALHEKRESFFDHGHFRVPLLHEKAQYLQVFAQLENLAANGQYTFSPSVHGNLQTVDRAFGSPRNPMREVDFKQAKKFMRWSEPIISGLLNKYIHYLEKVLLVEGYKMTATKVQFRWSQPGAAGIRYNSFHIDNAHYVRVVLSIDGKGPEYLHANHSPEATASYFTGGKGSKFWSVPAVEHRSPDYDGSLRRLILISFQPLRI